MNRVADGHATAAQRAAQHRERKDARLRKKAAQEAAAKARKAWLLDHYKNLCYDLFGRFVEGEDRKFAARLKQADLNLSPSVFKAMLLTTSILVGLGATLVVWVVFGIATTWTTGILWAAPIGLAAAIATVAAFPSTVGSRITKRCTAIEKELPFSLSEMSVAASIGLSPIQLFRKMADRKHDPAVTAELKKAVYMTDIQGRDLVTALSDTAREGPSPIFRETLWDMGNLIHQGGDLDQYLRGISQEIMDRKRANQKSFIERLTTYADMYVTVVLIGVMFLGIGAFLIDAFGTTAGPLDATGLLKLLTWGILPLIIIVLLIILNAAHSGVD